jgi:hypothetical protein
VEFGDPEAEAFGAVFLVLFNDAYSKVTRIESRRQEMPRIDSDIHD